MRRSWIGPLLLTVGTALAAESPEAGPAAGATAEGAATETEQPAGEIVKQISGMSLLGNQEAPKSLVIVPWKSSALADSLGIATILDDSRRPVDREVFLRELTYYQVRSARVP